MYNSNLIVATEFIYIIEIELNIKDFTWEIPRIHLQLLHMVSVRDSLSSSLYRFSIWISNFVLFRYIWGYNIGMSMANLKV